MRRSTLFSLSFLLALFLSFTFFMPDAKADAVESEVAAGFTISTYVHHGSPFICNCIVVNNDVHIYSIATTPNSKEVQVYILDHGNNQPSSYTKGSVAVTADIIRRYQKLPFNSYVYWKHSDNRRL